MKNLLVLLPGLFFERDYDRFGIKILKKNFSVKVLDFSPWLFPILWNSYAKDIYKCEEYISINNKSEFLNFLSQNKPEIIIDLLHVSKKTNWIRNQLKKNNNIFVNFNINLIPWSKKNLNHYLKYFFSIFIRPKKTILFIFQVLKNKYYNYYKVKADIVLVGGLDAKTKTSKKINAHCMDYDIYLNLKNKTKINNKPYAVFVDENMVHHPDYDILGMDKPVTEKEYYPSLVKFFKKFENETKLPVYFAVHPKTSNEVINKLPNLLQGIVYKVGNTPELIKNSEVTLLHASTSLSFAILFNKPVIFLTSKSLNNSWMGPRVNNLAKFVNGNIINIDQSIEKKIDLKNFLNIDTSKYKYYSDHFIKMPNSPNIPLWEIFSSELKNYNSINK